MGYFKDGGMHSRRLTILGNDAQWGAMELRIPGLPVFSSFLLSEYEYATSSDYVGRYVSRGYIHAADSPVSSTSLQQS